METLKTIEGISDGRLYDINDMVKADAGGCVGCSACCYGVGELVVLTPFDVFEITTYLNVSFDELIGDKFEMQMKDKIILPHLKMIGEIERCSFLNEDSRCLIHQYRPNICRLFPLGRVYKKDDFKYFLQIDGCVKPKLGKIKVKKWIGIENYKENKAFILEWYNLLKALIFRVKFIRDEAELKAINDYLLDTFYRMTVNDYEDFYAAFYERLPKAKNKLGII